MIKLSESLHILFLAVLAPKKPEWPEPDHLRQKPHYLPISTYCTQGLGKRVTGDCPSPNCHRKSKCKHQAWESYGLLCISSSPNFTTG